MYVAEGASSAIPDEDVAGNMGMYAFAGVAVQRGLLVTSMRGPWGGNDVVGMAVVAGIGEWRICNTYITGLC